MRAWREGFLREEDMEFAWFLVMTMVLTLGKTIDLLDLILSVYRDGEA
jgi:hypothetical protein